MVLITAFQLNSRGTAICTLQAANTCLAAVRVLVIHTVRVFGLLVSKKINLIVSLLKELALLVVVTKQTISIKRERYSKEVLNSMSVLM